MATLIIKTGKHAGKVLKIPKGEVVIGRDEDCQIRLATDDVSRRHCLLKSTPEGLVVIDLGSRNATFINDMAVTGEALLKPGDLLRVGPAVFELPGKKDQDAADERKPSEIPQEDDIAGWLTDGSVHDEPGEPSSGDTTIIKDRSKSTSADSKEEEGNPPASLLPKPQFESVAEEAIDIIRRHHEGLQEKS
jgi:pSer/pThr/pTyr-binding forkhead associated (FHA) protein